ncbi:MAG: hypothetical protein JWQ40_3921 [Segetibacter sp.]|nr:hypothetical protein [Segetibacter sp.]
MTEYLILILLKTKPFLQHVLLFLCLTKFLLFLVNKKRSWKIYNFLYFDNTHLILSHSQSSYNNKKLQNYLTVAIISLVGLQIIATILSNIVVFPK